MTINELIAISHSFAPSVAAAASGTPTPVTVNPSAAATATSTNIYQGFAANAQTVEALLWIGGVLLALAVALFIIAATRRPGNRTIVIVAWSSLVLGIVLVCVGGYIGGTSSRVSRVFSPMTMLSDTWTTYKNTYVVNLTSSTARTLDPSRQSVTTSEAESYTLLRAAWMDDQATFDTNWQWTQQNLQHSKDHLFSWLYGQQSNGSYGILTDQNGGNSASDADSDIALALVLAYDRWQNPQYLSAAKAIVGDIWTHEVITVAGSSYLAADNVEKTSGSPLIAINPSYFSPASYRIFAGIDSAHPWMTLLSNSYTLIGNSMDQNLDADSSAVLPPDWFGINRTTGAITPLTAANADSNYGYDAIRLPWRVALDWEWNQDPRDQQLLAKMAFLTSQWKGYGLDHAVYGHDGSPLGLYEAPSTYGGDIGYFITADVPDAEAVYRKKLLLLYDPGADDWKSPLSYYDANWAWFGIALYNHDLFNLAPSLPATKPAAS